jgi:hypothetical protein
MRAIVCLVFLSFSFSGYAQNYYKVFKQAKQARNAIFISRSTICTQRTLKSAYNAVLSNSAQVNINQLERMIVLESVIKQQLAEPVRISGEYNYLKAVSQSFRADPQWVDVNKSDSYNGIHHIINKSVLEVIYKQRKDGSYLLNYNDFLNNSPAVFHPFHNDKQFSWYFHNHKRQYELYVKYGVKGVLLDFFTEINKLNELYGLPVYADEFIENNMLQAKFWSDSYGLKWE